MTAPSEPLDVRRAFRDSRTPVLGGVASGLALHLGLPTLWVRLAFVVLGAAGGLGVALYAGLWMVLPSDARFAVTAPGLEAATRDGRRAPGRRRLVDAGPVIALAALGLGVVLAAEALLGRGALLWAVVVAAAGVALLWRQADEAQRERWRDTGGRMSAVRFVLGEGGWAAWARVGGGLVLVLVAFGLFAVASGGTVPVIRDILVAGVLGTLALAAVVGPWLWRISSDLAAERAERVRTQERADIAAHLHDSVLQTLALIQKHAGDQAAVARLARAQERDLRSWLYDETPPTETSLAASLKAVSAAVEDAHGVPVDVVTVGDVSGGERVRPLVEATREAVANAARHSGAPRIDVYAEASPTLAEVFVRDRGAGFDPDAVPADRLGLRRSIVGRMERHGGSAEVRSAPGQGTEVRLALPLEEES